MPIPRYNSYIICTCPRSGSTLLCKLLAETGISGVPNSHFHTPSLDRWLKTYELQKRKFNSEQEALQAIFDAARVRGTGNTGVFGLRLQRGSFDFFMKQTAMLFPGLESDFDRIQAAFGKTLFIHLTRPNKLDQAISLVKAAQTGLWHMAADGTELERVSEPQELQYDADIISNRLTDLSELDDAWRAWFKNENLEPLEITYDELSSDPQHVLRNILNELGLETPVAQNINSPTIKLADETSRTWANRFLAERDSA